MKRIQICDFVEWELTKFRKECNFTEDELEFFNLRAKNVPLERAAERMNISMSKADRLSRKVKAKIIKVL